MTKDYILALDQGTTSSRAILFDRQGKPVHIAQQEFDQLYPQPGWVEHRPEDIWLSQLNAARTVIAEAHARADQIAAIGITNQRETAIIWDRQTGKPIHNAIVWQCRRTADDCDRLRREGLSDMFQQRTGLVLDAYFSGTKVGWLLDHVVGAREMAAMGRLAFGTVDSWLIWKLTGGRVHVTDPSNASRTLLFNIEARAAARCRPVERRRRRDRSRSVRRRDTDCGQCRGPAGGAVRAGLHAARHVEKHLRHGLLHAVEHGARACPLD
jgi:glycerol kinase